MFNVIEKALGEVVRSGNAPTVSEAEMSSFGQTKSAAGTIVESLLFHTGLIVLNAVRVSKLEDRAQ